MVRRQGVIMGSDSRSTRDRAAVVAPALMDDPELLERLLGRRIRASDDAGGADVSEAELEALFLLAAAADRALTAPEPGPPRPLPATLRDRVIAAGERTMVDQVEQASRAPLGPRASERPAAGGWLGPMGWAVALGIALAWVLVAGPLDGSGMDPGERLSALLERPGTVTGEFEDLGVEGFEDVSGEVVWNTAEQAGVLRLQGLPANEPEREQYQLWIVDPGRDTEPVDGGVFNIPGATQETIVTVSAKLPIVAPEAFVITRERPGGVVVSDGPFLAAAQVDAREFDAGRDQVDGDGNGQETGQEIGQDRPE